jgi:hypothetical protein
MAARQASFFIDTSFQIESIIDNIAFKAISKLYAPHPQVTDSYGYLVSDPDCTVNFTDTCLILRKSVAGAGRAKMAVLDFSA